MSEVDAADRIPLVYRALVLAPDGAVVELHTLSAADDDEAISLAQAMMNGHAVELWAGLRFIEHIDPAEPQP